MAGFRLLFILVAASSLAFAGCQKSTSDSGTTNGDSAQGSQSQDGHDHPDPKTLAEAADVLKEMRDELAAAFKAADVKEVDKVIHEMGPVVKKAKEMTAELDESAREDADKALEQIMSVLGELHPAHGADAKVDPADYDAQKDSLNDALNNLSKQAG